jgi:hypothetical protein
MEASMTSWHILRTDYTDAGPVESLHRVFTGPKELLDAEVASLNAAKLRKPKHPDLRDSSGELFHPPTEFVAIPLAS